MNRKILIALCIGVIVVISVVAFVALKPQPSRTEITFFWNLEYHDRHKSLYLRVSNRGSEPVNITGVEMVYLPNDTLGLLWIEQHTIKSGQQKVFVWYAWYNESMDLPYIDIENSPERLAFFNLIQEGMHEPILEVTVATTEAIYTFNPPNSNEWTEPTSIEKLGE